MSESWEKESNTLEKVIKIEDYEVLSNVHQRKGVGGRPAIIVNLKKYTVENLTNLMFLERSQYISLKVFPVIWQNL